MNEIKAQEMALEALALVSIGNPVDVADTTVLFSNEDSTWSVCDNGEEVVCHSKAEVIRIIVENLTQ